MIAEQLLNPEKEVDIQKCGGQNLKPQIHITVKMLKIQRNNIKSCKRKISMYIQRQKQQTNITFFWQPESN